MATAPTLPAALKVPALDLNRFVLRAAQLEKVKPAIAYWCMTCLPLSSLFLR